MVKCNHLGRCTRSSVDKVQCSVTPDCKYGYGQMDPKVLLSATPVPANAVDLSVAVKADENKNRVDLLPIGPVLAIAEVLTFGAKKYDDHNWRKGFKWSRLIGAAMRHLFSFARGEDKDPETGLSHLAHLGCCVMFLLEHEQNKLGTDDRYKS